MSLSEQEQRALREIEQSLLAEDPRFSAQVQRTVSGHSGSYGSGVTLRGISLIVLGLVMLIGGVALSQHTLWFIALSIAGFIVMFGAGVWMLKGGSDAGAGAAAPTRKSKAATRSSGGSSVSQRMEDNFRRRFEG
ncbi:DUF3040 domain-containing protein [Corynebacterium uberis]|uniref:DUF3040 domain-containing protein n=1 Tax=Corynebacterium TaxID=1716 RepID=UPI001D0BE28B|nr:DUF3040 domain-containing protein [Corynebacterium uberis]MCZ9308298.1 DUF3040 domain-containing protein [Corynebacterium sp. c6VSa_13]UDL73974.1 DUF3040 domain-containing protein [Corynebacterium uberis]UDL75142.1 DUF3040 domain-containing protein [Corynebacterium uberis]UDL77354.1 DUF3040 domain-containing protein [Corynebacterium uberis]UDL79638.1 DUF3040 domain-containing protein [Corynebacterium uberis]